MGEVVPVFAAAERFQQSQCVCEPDTGNCADPGHINVQQRDLRRAVFFQGVIRVAIFLIYIVLISRTKDIKRTFMYHGAEHKCINCIEHGLELNVENVRKSSKQHKRCGTSFLFFVMIVSIIVCFFITAKSQIVRVLLRIALLPLIAGISYELIRLAGNSDHPVINVLSKPGLWVQNLTTKEPDDSMIEVGIKAVEAVFDWKTWQEENPKQ